MSEPIYLPGEYCEVCGAVENLGRWGFPGGLELTVCHPCHDGPRFVEWLAQEFEAALEDDPGFVRTADGKWTFVAAKETT